MIAASALLALASFVVASLCIAVCVKQLRRVRFVGGGKPRAVLQALQGDPKTWLESLAGASGIDEHDRARRLVTDVLGAPHRRAAVAELNEGLLEVDQQTAGTGHVSRASARIALATGGSCALLGLARGMSSGPGLDSWPLIAVGSGVGGAVVCLALSRAAVRSAKALRADYRMLARRLNVVMGAQVGANGKGSASRRR